MTRIPRNLFVLAFLFGYLFAPQTRAHFSWIVVDDQGHAQFFFGESIAERTYHLPDNLANVIIQRIDSQGKPTEVAMDPVDTEKLIGQRSTNKIDGGGTLACTAVYGIYHGTKLTYYNQNFMGNAKDWPTKPNDQLRMQAVLAADTTGLAVTIYFDGQPLADTKVQLFSSDGTERSSQTTDSAGRSHFDAKHIRAGIGGILAGHTDQTDSGILEEEEYESSTHYVTATFVAPESIIGSRPEVSTSKAGELRHVDGVAVIQPSELPDLPETLTSFGAAIAGGVLYVYGGHTGSAHSYSVSEQSDRFHALSLKGDSSQWQSLDSDLRLQGLAMVPNGNNVIRLGGFTAMNQLGQDHDLHSQNAVSQYDVNTAQWQRLPGLPEPRSSHDAVVLGRNLYVVGGWQLSGADQRVWHTTAWRMDLDNTETGWSRVPAPPTTRRALSLAAHDGRLFAIGGMTEKAGPSTVVEIFDPRQNEWTEGPALPGRPMNGFGNAAFVAGEDLYVTTIDGNALRLSAAGDAWEQIAEVNPPRFFHRMLPVDSKSLLIIGGANMSEGKYNSIDLLKIR